MSDWLVESEMVSTMLRMRELLVRHDENLKAWKLMSELVPYRIEDDAHIVRAREEQWLKVRHLFEPEAYVEFYANNPEFPYEQWGGADRVLDPLEAQDHYTRVLFAHHRLQAEPAKTAVDFSAHDGWMALNLEHHFPGLTVDCVDMNLVNTRAAKKRDLRGEVVLGDFRSVEGHWGVGFLFETVEHLLDPATDLRTIKACVDRLIVSTPIGAVESGNLPTWNATKPCGHVHAWSPQGFADLLSTVGEVEEMSFGSDRTMFAEIR